MQLFFSVTGSAAPVTVGPVVIPVPEGFQPAQTQRVRKTLITAWTKTEHRGRNKTLLQVNVIDLGAAREPLLSEPQLAAAAERYLRQFLAGIERRRSNYAVSPSASITLAGSPAVRASWNGALGEHAVVGVMYSVIVRNRFAVVFHTQDLGDTPTEGMFEAMRAVEAVTLAGAGE